MKLIDKLIKSALLVEMNPKENRDKLHPNVEAQIDDHDSDITKIIPPNFLSMIASKRYDELIKKLDEITGEKSPDWVGVMQKVMRAMQSIKRIEGPKIKELEKLAVDTVLSLPEWEIIRDRHIKKGWLNIIAKIEQPDFSKQLQEFEATIEEDEPFQVAETEIEVVELFEDEGKLKRDLANFITQGEAATGFNTFELIKVQINSIDPDLYDCYKLFVIGGLVNYFASDLNLIEASNAIASVEIEPDEDGYTIIASGANFVLLIHEIIKGLYDYLAVDVGPNTLEDMNNERVHTNAGPGIAKIFRQRFLAVADDGMNDLKYFPLVLRVLYGCDPENQVYGQDLKDIIANKPGGMQILKDCLNRVKQHYLSEGENDDESDNADSWKNG